jgi:hypothetical protein
MYTEEAEAEGGIIQRLAAVLEVPLIGRKAVELTLSEAEETGEDYGEAVLRLFLAKARPEVSK